MKPWEVLSAFQLISAPPWLEVFQEKVRLPSGRLIEDFYRVITPDFSVVVAVTLDGRLLMVRGYRHGPQRICLSAPAGLIEPGESPLVAAQRELLEETGYSSSEWVSLGSFTVDSNRQCGTAHIFLAKNTVQIATVKKDDAEELEVELIRPQDFLQAIRGSDVSTLATVGAISLAIAYGLD
ncbi:MAG: NUDIX hydrolase [Acidobacteria bacterium]|nr:MAG: NUDIX hydrolase [Acidobacteriota bacterium]